MRSASSNDRGLLARYVADRDEQAMHELMVRHQPMVEAVARRILGDAAAAEDVAQDCFIEFSRKAAELREPAAWLHRTATHRAIDHLRARRARPEVQADTETSYHIRTPDWDIKAQLDQALDELTDEQRTLLVRHVLEGCSQRALARELGIDVATVSRRLEAARKQLRRSLRQRGVAAPAVAALLVEGLPAGHGIPVAAGFKAAARRCGSVAVQVGGLAAGLALALGVLLWMDSQPLEVAAVEPEPAFVRATPPVAAPEAPVPTLRVSRIGNGLGGIELLPDLRALTVLPDGSCIAVSPQPPLTSLLPLVREGRQVGSVELHGRPSGTAVTHDAEYLYLAGAIGWEETDRAVFRYRHDGSPAPLVDGIGPDRTGRALGDRGRIAGIASDGTLLYISLPDHELVQAHRLDDLREAWRFPIAAPRDLAAHPDGGVWVRTAAGALRRITAAGQERSLPGVLGLPPLACIGAGPDGEMLGVTQGDGQVVVHDRQARLIGVGPSAPLAGVTGIGRDTAGRWYFAANGRGPESQRYLASALLALEPVGGLAWQLRGQVPEIDGADVDPATGEVFTASEWFQLDETVAAGWRPGGSTIDPQRYPDDPRLHGIGNGVQLRRLAGQRWLFVNHGFGNLLVCRLDDGRVAEPKQFLITAASDRQAVRGGDWPPGQPDGSWWWRDADADGAIDPEEYAAFDDYIYAGSSWIDEQGDLWRCLRLRDAVSHRRLRGIDPVSGPQWDEAVVTPVPEPFTAGQRLEYRAADDVLVLAGRTADRPIAIDDRVLGSVLAWYDGWQHGARQERWRIEIPRQPDDPIGFVGMSLAGDYLFLAEGRCARVHVLDGRDGSTLTVLEPPEGLGPQYESHWLWSAMRARHLGGPDYEILAYDRCAFIRYRWTAPR